MHVPAQLAVLRAQRRRGDHDRRPPEEGERDRLALGRRGPRAPSRPGSRPAAACAATGRRAPGAPAAGASRSARSPGSRRSRRPSRRSPRPRGRAPDRRPSAPAPARPASKPRRRSPPSPSYTALRVPGTLRTAASTAPPRASSRAGSAATTRTPTGVRTPVDIMSMRARTGAVQAFVQPGRYMCASRCSTSSSVVIGARSGQIRRSRRLTGSGAQLEYQRAWKTLGQLARGLSRMVVSAIENGAGSVALSERPILPNTVCTPGRAAMSRSCSVSSPCASSALSPAAAVGMYSSSPSSMCGRNSLPRCETIGRQEIASQRRRHQRDRGAGEDEVHERPVRAHEHGASAGCAAPGRCGPGPADRAAPGRASA